MADAPDPDWTPITPAEQFERLKKAVRESPFDVPKRALEQRLKRKAVEDEAKARVEAERAAKVEAARERSPEPADTEVKKVGGDPVTRERGRIKEVGLGLVSTKLPEHLRKVAARRGLQETDPSEILQAILEGAKRPLTQGYDPANPIYSPDERGFDPDAWEVANIMAMQSIGVKYASPQELRENFGVDAERAEGDLTAAAGRLSQAAQEEGTIHLAGAVDGEEVGKATHARKSKDLNRQVARLLPNGADRTLALMDLPDDIVDAVRAVRANPVTTKEATLMGFSPEFQQEQVAMSQIRNPTRPQQVVFSLFQADDGNYFANLSKLEKEYRVAKHRELATRNPEMSWDEVDKAARKEARRMVQRMADIEAPIYDPDPLRTFDKFVAGEGLRGGVFNIVDTAKSVADQTPVTKLAARAQRALMTFGTSEVVDRYLGVDSALMGGISSYLKTQGALTLPPISTTGRTRHASGMEGETHEFGGFSKLLSDNRVTRTVDQLFRMNAVSEGYAAAYGMAVDDVLAEKGTIDGEGVEINRRALEHYGSEDHLWRVATRDDDYGTLLFTLGRAFDPTTLLGLTEKPLWPGATTATAGMMVLVAGVFEPDILTTVMPIAKVAKAGIMLSKFAGNMDRASTLGRSAKYIKYTRRAAPGGSRGGVRATRGLDAIRGLQADLAAGTIQPTEVLETLEAAAQADPSGAFGTVLRSAGIQTAQVMHRGVLATPSGRADIIKPLLEGEKLVELELATLKKQTEAALKKLLSNYTPTPADIAAFDAYKVFDMEAAAKQGATRIRRGAARSVQNAKARLQRVRAAVAQITPLPPATRRVLEEQVAHLPGMKEADKVAFLSSRSVQKILANAGLDPAEVAAKAETLRRTGAKDVINPAEWREFYTGLQASLGDALRKTPAQLARDAVGAAQAELSYARRAYTTAKTQEAAATAAYHQAVATIRGLSPAAAVAPDVRKWAKKAAKAYERVDTLQRKLDLQTAQHAVKVSAPEQAVKVLVDKVAELVEGAEALGGAGVKAREELARLAEATRTGKVPGAHQVGVEVLKTAARDAKLRTFLKGRTPEEIGHLFHNNLYMKEALLAEGAVADMLSSMPKGSYLDLHRRMNVFKYTATRWHRSLVRFLSVEPGAVDIQVGTELKDATSAQSIRYRAWNNDLDEFIKANTPKGIAPDALYQHQRDLTFEFLSGTDRIEIKTSVGQEFWLVSRVGDVPILEEAIEHLRGVVRLGVTGIAGDDPLLTALVKSFARDRHAADTVAESTSIAIARALPRLQELFDRTTDMAVIFDEMPEIFRTSWTHRQAKGVMKDHALYTRNLIAAAAEGRLLKRVTGGELARRFLLAPGVARSMDSILGEGMHTTLPGVSEVVKGDIVILTTVARRFNAAVNAPRKTKATRAKVKGVTFESPGKQHVPGGFPEDLRVRKEGDETSKSTVQGEVGVSNRGTQRDYWAEQQLRSSPDMEGLRVVNMFKRGDVDMVELTALDGTPRGARKLEEVTHRDPLLGWNDALDNIFALGLAVAQGRKKPLTESVGAARDAYSKLVARSMDKDGNILYVPKDLSKGMYDALERIEKDLVDLPGKKGPGALVVDKIKAGFRLYKRAILFGLVIPRAAFFSNAIWGDNTQLLVELNDLSLSPLSPRSRGTLGTLLAALPGYAPFARTRLQEWVGARAAGGRATLPPWMGAITDNRVRAVLRGDDEMIAITRGGKTTYESAKSILSKALDEGAGDNILTADAMKGLRRAKDPSWAAEKWEGISRLMEVQLREGTRHQRVLTFLALYADGGMTQQKAGLRMRQALYNWDTAVGKTEIQYIRDHVLFYTFLKNAFAQAHRTIFEGFDEGLDVHLKKYARGNTKLQRLEALAAFSGGWPLELLKGEEGQVSSPAEAQAYASLGRAPDYLVEYTLMDKAPLTAEGQKVARSIYGRNYDSRAGVLPKITHIEFLNEYVRFVNLLAAVPMRAAISKVTGGQESGDPGTWGLALLRAATDLAHPASGAAMEGLAATVDAIPRGAFVKGHKVRAGEVAFLISIGMEDSLERQDDGSYRIRAGSTAGFLAKTLASSGGIGLMRTFALPEYTRARLLDEVIFGGQLTKEMLPMFRMFFPNKLTDAEIEKVQSGPIAVHMTREEKGEAEARLTAFTEYMGFYINRYYSGKFTQDYRVKAARAMQADLRSQAAKRGTL